MKNSFGDKKFLCMIEKGSRFTDSILIKDFIINNDSIIIITFEDMNGLSKADDEILISSAPSSVLERLIKELQNVINRLGKGQ